MQKNLLNKSMLLATVALFAINFTPALAQVMEIEVIGGGYGLSGPCLLEFTPVDASFNVQETTLNIRDLTNNCDQGGKRKNTNYLEITDHNGGLPFSVSVSSEDLTSGTNGTNIIPAGKFFVQNRDNDQNTKDIDTIKKTPENIVTLDPETGNFAGLDTTRTLLNSNGQAPGAWRIYPLFKIEIPASTPPGTYRTTLTFTVT